MKKIETQKNKLQKKMNAKNKNMKKKTEKKKLKIMCLKRKTVLGVTSKLGCKPNSTIL